MAGITRSISESTAICQIQDYSLGSIISKGLAECWKEDLLFDFDVVTMERHVVKCHKIVLASVSPFFKAALSPMHLSIDVANKNQIDLPNVTYNAMKSICEFVYTGVAEVYVKDLQELVMAANFLQLHSLEQKCAESLYDYTDEANVIEISRFALQVGILPLIQLCRSFMESAFDKILHSDLIYDFTEDELKQVLHEFNIVVKDIHGCIPPISIQEKILFLAVIKFVNQKYTSNDNKHRAFEKLSGYIRLDALMKYEHDSLMEFVNALSDSSLKVRCATVLKSTRDYNSQKGLKQEVSKRQLNAEIPYKSVVLAHGYETNIRGFFDDGCPTNDHYVKGMKIWIRRWDGRPVYGGFKVSYSDGRTEFHGQRSNHEVYDFTLGPDEFIVKVIAFSGYMVDNLEFITNTGKSYGPFGGGGGGKRVLAHPRGPGYLSHVSGSEAFTQGSLGIVSLSFHFVFWSQPGDIPEDADNESPCNSSSSYDDDFYS